jgi:hypothetical protein
MLVGEGEGRCANGLACRFIETDDNEESVFVRRVDSPGANDPYSALKTTLTTEIDAEAWATLNSDTSRPFAKPKSGWMGVKVINHLGDEGIKVFRIKRVGIPRRKRNSQDTTRPGHDDDRWNRVPWIDDSDATDRSDPRESGPVASLSEPENRLPKNPRSDRQMIPDVTAEEPESSTRTRSVHRFPMPDLRLLAHHPGVERGRCGTAVSLLNLCDHLVLCRSRNEPERARRTNPSERAKRTRASAPNEPERARRTNPSGFFSGVRTTDRPSWPRALLRIWEAQPCH